MKAQVEGVLYDRGTARMPEDGFWHILPTVGVWDGVSAPYNDKHPPVLFGGQMAGEWIARILRTRGDEDLETALRIVNKRIREAQLDQGKDASQLGGATFVLAEINSELVKIIYGGDCYVVWLKKSGKIGITHNQFRPYEVVLRAKIAQLMKETHGDHKQMWRLFYPFLCQSRIENTNIPGRCAILNGQREVFGCWTELTLPASELDLLLLFTDGLVPFSQTENERQLAREVVGLYNKEGLHQILAWTRKVEGKEAESSHESFAEATGLAVRFSE